MKNGYHVGYQYESQWPTCQCVCRIEMLISAHIIQIWWLFFRPPSYYHSNLDSTEIYYRRKPRKYGTTSRSSLESRLKHCRIMLYSLRLDCSNQRCVKESLSCLCFRFFSFWSSSELFWSCMRLRIKNRPGQCACKGSYPGDVIVRWLWWFQLTG